MQIIGFMGPQGAGKSALATALADTFEPGEALIEHFAAPIKEMVGRLFPDYPVAQMNKSHRPIEFGGKSIREIYQLLGTDWGRKMVCPDIWVRFMESRINWISDMADLPKFLFIDDVRFYNEINWIRAEAGYVISVPAWDPLKPDDDKHESEVEWRLAAPDYTIGSTSLAERVEEMRKFFNLE